MPRISEALVRRLFRNARAERWDVPLEAFAEALDRSAARAGEGKTSAEIERYLGSLHLGDLALACACAAGHEAAWEYFVLEYRPALYRAAEAIDRSGSARELADSLYAELYGLRDRDGARQSLFRYFHGRSSLATWLRAVLAQRHVDVVRTHRRFEPLPDEESAAAPVSRGAPPDADRRRFLAMIQQALAESVSGLPPRDRLRLGCYYAQEMTLAQIGRLLHEHEGTVSRHLSRTRRAIRDDVERRLRDGYGLGDREIEECFASVMDDVGAIDLAEMLPAGGDRKKSRLDRSTNEGMP
jgi:RNA polymerase sigma-70 factor (ECF subfamily)